MGRAAVAVELSTEEQAELSRLLRTPSTPQQIALRARIVQRAAEGATNTEIARELGTSLPTVALWRRGFAEQGIAGLSDRPRSGRPRTIDEAAVKRVIAKTLERPPEGESHWSVRALAREVGLAPSTVARIWREHRLKPHQARTFKYSTDPELEAKVIDIVGLYLDPPEGALVLCVDEKTQIQALDRTQPIPPLRPGLPEGRTHDHRRNGTTSLYAALEVATGRVLTECHPRHRAEEFLAFCRRIVRERPTGELHIVLDSSSTHSTPEVKRWLARHRRVHFHFTPKGASWMNMVESWFSILTRRSVRRGSFASVAELVAAIERFVLAYSERAQPFVWTRTAEEVLTKAVKRQDTSGTEH
ncbi:MAG: IS630 family transposase [Thermoleophilia bacterium]|jgi:transposase|nr:IS630 family transposase [Thermoleophilia bacterium]